MDAEHAAQANPAGDVLPLPQAPDAIELRHLRAFVAVAEELNFGRAASRLYLSAPALSRQIRALERLVGCELLRRSTHRVELTVAGEALLDRAHRLLRDVDDAITTTRSVGGELVERAARLWEPIIDMVAGDCELEDLRTAYEELHAQFPPPPEIHLRPVNAGGVPSLVLTPDRERRPITLLYLHGGGYVLGSAFGYRHVGGALAVAAGTGILLPDYRLAPEYPFPAGIDDALRAYVWALENGADPRTMTLVGDSSGAALVLALLISAQRRNLPLPGGAVLYCPGVDIAGMLRDLPPDGGSQPALSTRHIRRFTGYYLAGHPADDPLVTPLRADLTGLPPMLIQAATGDPYIEDAHRLADRARAQGVDVRLQLYPVTTHVFQIFWSFLPEAADALRQAAEFVREIQGGRVGL